MRKALEILLITWKKCETNLIPKLKEIIDEIINGKAYNLEALDDIVREEAAGRIFRSRDAPENIKKLTSPMFQLIYWNNMQNIKRVITKKHSKGY